MVHFKDIFKILIVLQIVSHAVATLRHPDAEIINVGAYPFHDQTIIEAAIRNGMDGEAVAELLRTKQPVVKVFNTPNGLTKTTTYKLDDDGTISSKTITQTRKTVTYHSDSVPDDIRNSPTGTVTRTFTDENGQKVTQTFSVDKPKPSSVLDTDDLTGDWFNKPFQSWQPKSQFPSSHRTYTRTFASPNGDSHTVQSWPSDPDFNEPITTSSQATPATSYHRTVTRTYTGPNGEKRITQISSSDPDDRDFTAPKQPKFSATGSDNWPTFEFPAFSESWGSSDTDSDDDWTILGENPEEVETTTKKRFESWTPKTWNWPEFPTFPITTTTAKPKIYIEPEITTRKPLPSLDDFLKTQYSPTTTAKTPTVKTTTITPKYYTTATTKKPIHINIDDLPITEILYNGKPADDNILKRLPPNLRPKLNTENIFQIENIAPIDQDAHVDVFNPREQTNTRTYTNTVSSSQRPTIQDLDPQMQEVLKKAGISSEDITNIDGDTITRTRTEPDGRTITTTFRVKTVPPVMHTSPEENIPVIHTSSKETTPKATAPTFKPYRPNHMSPMTPLKPLNPNHYRSVSNNLSPISEFLAKLGLTKFDVSSQNGRLTRTLIDENGDLLTATFVLSSPIRKRSIPEWRENPLKFSG